MATSKTTIVNQALLLLGQERIDSIDEGTTVADDFKEIYDDIRDEVLRAAVWRFARRRIKIDKDPTPPEFGYGARYASPTDPYCLRVLEPDRERSLEEPWEVEGRWILTDIASPLAIFFIARVTNEAEFDPLFVSCFAARLANALAFKITDRESLQDKMWNLYQARLPDARTISSQEGSQDDRTLSGTFVDARLDGGYVVR